MEIIGKVAVVTGAGGGGSGRAIARRLARDGAAVIVSDIDEAGGQETVRQIEREGGRAAFFRADVGVEAQVRALFGFADERHGGVDILINTAGPYFPEPLEKWMKTVHANLLGTMYGTLCAIGSMTKRDGGAIVNFGSTSAVGHGRDHSSAPAYDVAKAGIMRLTTTLGWLKERHRIRVNCIVPHWVATEEVAGFVAGLTPQQRVEYKVPDVLLTTDEIADAVLQLVTDEVLAGRVLICRGGEPHALIADGDRGYAQLEVKS